MSRASRPSRGEPVFLRTTAPTPADAPVAERFHACVRNTGNYFFEESLLRQLPGIAVYDTIETLPRQIGTLVLSMSNFISPSTDLGYLHDALAARRIDQIVMIGAGAQAYAYGDSVTLTEGTRRFLSYVADRSISIGVRGYYTADVLAELGIRNVEVVGCPSAFWSGHAPSILPACAPDHAGDRRLERLAVHCTPLGHFRDKISALLAHGMRHGADYVMQSESWMMPLLGASDDLAALDEGLLYYGYPCCDPEELRRWLSGHLLVFFGIEDWLRWLSRYDFVYGSRFHGNMAAIHAGVPALNMPFDTRTRELCEYLNLPILPLVEFEADIGLERLREYADRTWSTSASGCGDVTRLNVTILRAFQILAACSIEATWAGPIDGSMSKATVLFGQSLFSPSEKGWIVPGPGAGRFIGTMVSRLFGSRPTASASNPCASSRRLRSVSFWTSACCPRTMSPSAIASPCTFI